MRFLKSSIAQLFNTIVIEHSLSTSALSESMCNDRCCYLNAKVVALISAIVSTCIAIVVLSIIIAENHIVMIAPLVTVILEILLIAMTVQFFYFTASPFGNSICEKHDSHCGTRTIFAILGVVFLVLSVVIIYSIRSMQSYISIVKRERQRSFRAHQTVAYVIPSNANPTTFTSTGVTQPQFMMYPVANNAINTSSPIFVSAPFIAANSAPVISHCSPSPMPSATAPPFESPDVKPPFGTPPPPI
ncbi:hypothetical protein Tcan_04588 [Toxocara canis]|uniref:Uncharacterized protein n=1 Tax=Toxocara canis TaxID=6265 RepID=A0A0B2V702_TOXCA|nr:hypothetical protein Tcan_04588 [Toxocara canis]